VPTLRRRCAALIGALAVFSTVFLTGGAALAQTGYPPGTSVPSCVPANVNAGTIAVGQTVTFTLCGNFAAGATVTVTVNGAPTLTKTPTNGAVEVVVTAVSTTVLQVGDPTNVAAICGTNTVTATGATTAGVGTSTGTFTLVCTTTATTSSPLAFTGANVLLALGVALVLIVLGALLVVFQRRRRQTI
jgi:hypothetical protein